MEKFTKISIWKALPNLFIGFLPFVGIGIVSIGVRYLFSNLIVGIITFFALSVLFIIGMSVFKKKRKSTIPISQDNSGISSLESIPSDNSDMSSLDPVSPEVSDIKSPL